MSPRDWARSVVGLPRRFWQVAFWLPWAVCTWFAFTPAPLRVGVEALNDKVEHGLAFCLLMIGLTLAYFPASSLSRPAMLLIAYGAAIELVQSVLPNRYAEFGDLAANLIGLAVGAGLLLLMRRLARPSTASAEAAA